MAAPVREGHLLCEELWPRRLSTIWVVSLSILAAAFAAPREKSRVILYRCCIDWTPRRCLIKVSQNGKTISTVYLGGGGGQRDCGDGWTQSGGDGEKGGGESKWDTRTKTSGRTLSGRQSETGVQLNSPSNPPRTEKMGNKKRASHKIMCRT